MAVFLQSRYFLLAEPWELRARTNLAGPISNFTEKEAKAPEGWYLLKDMVFSVAWGDENITHFGFCYLFVFDSFLSFVTMVRGLWNFFDGLLMIRSFKGSCIVWMKYLSWLPILKLEIKNIMDQTNMKNHFKMTEWLVALTKPDWRRKGI